MSSSEQTVEVLVDGGKATPGPPLGPALGPLGINVKAVVDEINRVTSDYAGMKVPVKITVKADRTFTVTVGTPPTSALILKEAGIPKGSGEPNKNFVGNITMEQAKKIARMKRKDMLASNFKAAVKEVVSTCMSMGITVDGKDPRIIHQEIAEGTHDDKLQDD